MTTTYDQSTVTYDQSSLTYQGLPTQFDGISFAVEMAFGYEPLDDDAQWEVVTAYVRGFDISRGRNSEFTTYGPGTVSIALDNRDRRFDPEYTSGPYFGQLNPMVPVRVQATYSGTTYTMFYGFVQGWPTIYNQSNTDAVASVTAIDANRLLGNLPLPASKYEERLRADSPSFYLPLQETGERSYNTATSFYDYVWETYNQSTEMRFPISGSRGMSGSFRIQPSVFLSVGSRITYWMVLDRGLAVRAANTSFEYSLTLVPGSTNSTFSYRFPGAGRLFSGTKNLNLSTGPHHVAMLIDTASFDIIIDGVSVWTGTSSAVVSPISANEVTVVATGRDAIGHFAMFSSASFDDTNFTSNTYYDLGIAPFAGEVSSARLSRVLDDSGWPTAWRDIETGVQQVGSYAPESLPVSQYFPQVDNAEQGSLFVNREGDVEFRSRSTAEAVQVVGLFDDSGTDLPFANVTVDAHTVDAIRNNVVVTYANGSTTSTDAGSVAAYGQASQTIDARLVDDATVAQSIGDTLLARAKDPRTRITRLDVNVRRDPAGIVPVVAALDLSDDVTVSLTPTGVGSALWRAVRVQGISHRVTPQSWDVSLYLAPGPVNTNGPLMILDDGTYGVLDSNKLG